MMVADAVRFVVLCSGMAVLGITLVVIVNYASVYVAHRRTDEAPWKGLLPFHVVIIGVSYLLLVGAGVTESVIRLNDDLTWRAPVYAAANILGIVALWSILGNSKHRKANLTDHTTEQT